MTKISVTQADIDQGCINYLHGPNISLCCPLALAISRAIGKDVSVGITRFFLINTNNPEYGLPDKATDFVLSFHANAISSKENLTPFDFEVSCD